MKTYKVIALSVGGLGNKIFESGDIVTDENFAQGRTIDLVAQGFLEEEAEERSAKEAEEQANLKEKEKKSTNKK